MIIKHVHVDVATEPAIVEEPKPTVVSTPVQSPIQTKAHTSKYIQIQFFAI